MCVDILRHQPAERKLVPPSAEDVLGAFFGRHTRLSSAMQPAFWGQPERERQALECSSASAKAQMHPSDPSSLLQEARHGNIVPLSHQRRDSRQHSHAASAQCRARAEHARSGATVTGSNLRGLHSPVAPHCVRQAAAAAQLEPKQVVTRRDAAKEELSHSVNAPRRGEQPMYWI